MISERDSLSTEVRVLKEQPELLQEIQEKFYDQPGLIDAKKLQKIGMQRCIARWSRIWSISTGRNIYHD
jgi:hypothetical protein